MNAQGCEQLTLFPADSRASHFLWPGSEEARRMTVTSGRKCCELYRRSGPLGSLVRMLLVSSAWRSTRCYLTWKVSATPAKRLLFRLRPSTPRIDGTDVLFWPTPSASDCGRTAINPHFTKNGTIRHIGKSGGQSYARLDAVAALFPTPTASCGTGPSWTETRQGGMDLQTAVMYPTPLSSDWKNRGCADSRRNRECQLQTVIGGQLNPAWVEWLMGFPIGWTDLDA